MDLQTFESCVIWVLGSELGSSKRISTASYWAIFPVPASPWLFSVVPEILVYVESDKRDETNTDKEGMVWSSLAIDDLQSPEESMGKLLNKN